MRITVLFLTTIYCVGVRCVGGNIRFPGLTIRHYASLREELRQIFSRITLHGLGRLLDRPNLTVFLPNTDAMLRFENNQLGYDSNSTETIRMLLLYHSVEGLIQREVIENNMKLRATTPAEKLLYFNTFTDHDGSMIYTVNGARILTSGFVADNGIIYIIDRVMSPFGSEKTVTEYYNKPDVPYLSFMSITTLQEINRGLFQDGADPGNFFTMFAPNDSYTYPIPEAAQQIFYTNWTLINDTIKAHTVRDVVMCLPAEGNIPDMTSLNGKLKFTRKDDRVYVENNRVRAEVIIPNIPLVNGVLHIIDNLLFFIYDTVYQRLAQLEEARIFNDVAVSIPTFTTQLQSKTSKVTLFVPVTSAFVKVSSWGDIIKNVTRLTQLLDSHLIIGQELDLETLLKLGNVTTHGNRTIKLISMNNGIYIQHNGMRTEVVRGDIGCTNGVVHLINDVMIDSDLTIWDNIESQGALSFVFDLMRNHVDLRTTLSADDGSQLTVFLPGSIFMDELPQYSRNMLLAGGSRVHEALKGHIVEDIVIGSADFKDRAERKLTTMDGGMLYVTKRGQDIFVNGSHVTGRVIVSDIWCSNGVIHIVDTFLHLPTRNALDQMNRLEETSISALLFATSEKDRHLLEGNFTTVSVFVPSDTALARIPPFHVQQLRDVPGRLQKFIRAHIVRGRAIYTGSVPAVGELFSAEEGKLHVAMSGDRFYVKNGGVKAWFTLTDIPVTNGVIHVIDGPVWLAYKTVEEVLISAPELMPFYSLISRLPVTQETLRSGLPLTMFAPSAGYFASIESKLPMLRTRHDLLRKIFVGHVMQSLVVNRTYINPQGNNWNFTNNFNVTFRFKKETQDSFGIGVYETFSVAMSKTQIKCTDGVIYVIDSPLNFSPYTAREVSEREPNLRNIFHGLLLRSWDGHVTDPHVPYTILAPEDSTTRKQGRAIEDVFNSSQILQQVTWRHVVLGRILTLEDLVEASNANNFTENNITFSREEDDVFVTWGQVRGRVVRSNMLTTHGIIHIVDKIFYQAETPETTTTPATTTTSTRSAGTTVPTKVTQRARTGKSSDGSGISDLRPNFSLLCLFIMAVAVSC